MEAVKDPKATPIKFNVCVVVPVLEIRGFDSKWSQSLFEGTLQELIAFSSTDFELGFKDYVFENFRVQLLKKPKRKKSHAVTVSGKILPRLWNELNISFSCNLILTDFSIQTIDGKPATTLSLGQRQAMCAQVACETFAYAVTKLLVATQIAKPDVINVNDIELFINNRFFETEKSVRRFGSIGDFIDKGQWPPIEPLPIQAAWQWLCSFVPLSENLGKTAVERALNAFTYLIKNSSANRTELENLMWAMIGLEALYGRGTSDLTFQLVEKVGVLLGKDKHFEKRLKEMYRFRSMFIHGKTNFPGAFFTADGLPEFDQFMEKSDVTTLAEALLIASLQQLVKRNWKALSFSFVPDDPPQET